MYQDYRVVAVTPAGRRRYLEILLNYMLDNRYTPVDVWQLWVNTTDQNDIDWMEAKAKEYPKFIELIYPTEPVNQNFQAYSIYQFFKHCTDENTIYVRMDDDIVYVHPTAIQALCLARCRISHPFLVCANIINNAICTHIHQRMGIVSTERGIVSHNCLDSLGWASGEFAEYIHNRFLEVHGKKEDYKYSFNNWYLVPVERFSINCFAFFGKDFKEFDGAVEIEEEEWLTVTRPKELNRPLLVIGNALVSHFAYFPQRPYLDYTNLLGRYKSLSEICRRRY